MTTFLVCGDATTPTLEALGTARVAVVPDLCARLRELDRLVDGDRHLVLGIHHRHVDLGTLQAAVRRVGLDPLRVGLLELDTVAAGADDLRPALAATAARSRHSRRADPTQVKLLPPDRSTRRALLSIGKPRYITAPGVDHTRCHVADGCRACIDTCPTDALSWDRTAIAHDTAACVVCGRCITTCPADAIENPDVHAEAIEAEIRAAIEHAGTPLGVRYRCRNASVTAAPGWYQVEVPCTGMLTAGWALAPLAMGAGAVDVVTCAAGGCPLANDHITGAMLADLALITDRLGIRLDRPVDPARVAAAAEPLLTAGSTARLATWFASGDADDGPLPLTSADVGQVTVDPATCTACERCAQVCPSGAMTSRRPEHDIELIFDPRRCTGCAGCLAVCPEVDRGAITMRRELDLDELARGARVVREEPIATCEVCGSPIAPASMLARVASMLGDDAERAMSVLGRRCQRCRGR